MNKVFFLLAIIISISISPAFAQEVTGQRLTVSADNTAYRYGDIITVSGDVEKILPGTPVILQVFFERTQVDVAQVSVSQNGKFSTTFVAAGPLWVKDGTVIVRIAYGSSIAETTFDFFKKSTEDDFTSNYEVNIPDSGTFDIPYTIRGGHQPSMADIDLSIEFCRALRSTVGNKADLLFGTHEDRHDRS